jgi:transmembrane sensor
MSRLRFPLRSALRDDVDDAVLHRMWQEIDGRFPAAPVRRRSWSASAVAVVVAGVLGASGVAGIALSSLLRRGDAGPLRRADGAALAAVEAAPNGPRGTSVALADGSRIELERGARLEPLESSGTTFAAVLARGSAVFEVRPGGPRRWTIECGLATVEVVGTRFSCERRAGRLRVTVDRGTVLVRGERVPDRARRLGAGEVIDILERPPEAAPAAPADPIPSPSEAVAPAPPRQAGALPRAALAAAAPPAWRDLARGGRHEEAFRALGADGLRRETRRLGVRDLLALADVARLSGHPADAVAPLERILSEFSSDPQAPLAAFALGRIELDALSHPPEARAAFERALALGVPAGLREDTRARLVEACVRAGEAGAAAAAASAYAREYPGGRYTRAIEAWLSGP